MPTLPELVTSHTDLDEADLAWLQLLLADWQIFADLSFADLVLWLPDRAGNGFWAAGQMRPTTGPTAYVDDVVGTFLPAGKWDVLDEAWARGRVVRDGDPEWREDVPVRVEAIPVRRGDQVIAVVARNTNLLGVRTPSRLELAYLQAADELARMIASGDFPGLGERGAEADSPRVGDGFVRLSAESQVAYASPNAQSVFRRLGFVGDLEGQLLTDIVRELVPPRLRIDEESISAVLGGRAHRDTEVARGSLAIYARSIPLVRQGSRVGAIVLVRDVTDLRRRDRELLTKDATIREIHHRVKNNLQTVAALLRLQGRRIGDGPARDALDEAVRRVGSIALVHEILSQQDVEELVEFDEIADRLAQMVGEVTSVGVQARVRRTGSFGALPSEVATPLAMVLTELLQNAVEHGYPQSLASAGVGRIEMRVSRPQGHLELVIEDDGQGLPAGFDLETTSSLGLSIVKTLVESELDGRLELGSRTDARGARALIDVPTGSRRR